MNIPPSVGLTGYNSGAVSPQRVSAPASAPTSVIKPDSSTAEATKKTAEINRREDSQGLRTLADNNLRNAAATEYLPARDEDSESTGISTRSLVSDPQRPEIQAFLNTSASDGTSRRGRFIDIQA